MPRTATNEAVTSSVQMAIWTQSSASRSAKPRENTGSIDPPFIACNGWLCHTCRAGAIPESSALTKVRIRAIP